VKTGLQKLPVTELMMTVFAFEFFYFIKNVSLAVLLFCFMALITGHISVFSIQWEERFTVIKFCDRFECQQIMTSGTISNPVLFELLQMDVLMAF
jgi:hypothetical protein